MEECTREMEYVELKTRVECVRAYLENERYPEISMICALLKIDFPKQERSGDEL